MKSRVYIQSIQVSGRNEDHSPQGFLLSVFQAPSDPEGFLGGSSGVTFQVRSVEGLQVGEHYDLELKPAK